MVKAIAFIETLYRLLRFSISLASIKGFRGGLLIIDALAVWFIIEYYFTKYDPAPGAEAPSGAYFNKEFTYKML